MDSERPPLNLKTELSSLVKHLEILKEDIKTLEKRKGRLQRSIKKLDEKREQKYREIQIIRDEPLHLLIARMKDSDQLVQITVSGSKILKVDNILKKAKAMYFVESLTGFCMEEKQNKGKKAYFYFSPRIAPTAFAKIQKLGKLRYYRTGSER